MKKLIIMLSAITLIACKNSAKTTKVENPSTTQETTNSDEKTFDVIVQFISKGEGTARELGVKFDEAVAKFNKDNHTNIEADRRQWGREGEYDLNFDLKNLSTKQKNSFLSLVKETVGHTDMVHLKYNEKAVHKR
jgi:maltose-binding protein MalE